MSLPTDPGSTSDVPDQAAGRLILRQPDRGHRYGLDPFLLADFCRPRRGERILDLGSGNGVIGLQLARRYPTVTVTGIELQQDLVHFAAANTRSNALAGRCRFIRGDLRDAPRFLPPEHFHRVVTNPPFRKSGSGATPPDPGRASARQDRTFTLDHLATTAAALLRFGGTLCIIHLAERLPEICAALSESGLTPKKLRLITPYAHSTPRLCLVAAIKGGRPGLSVQSQLVLHEPGGRYTGEVARILYGAADGEHQKTHA